MILPGRATGSPNLNPARGRRAEAGAFLARSASALRSPLLRRKTSPRSPGSAASTACRSMTASPSTTPSRKPLFASKPTIFMNLVPDLSRRKQGLAQEGRFWKVTHRLGRRLLNSQREGLDREIIALIGPSGRRLPAGAARQRAQGLDAVFVAVLGVDRFAGAKFDGFAGHFHLLPFQAGKMHFDAMTLAVVEGVVLEGIELEGAAEFAIDAHQQVEVELGGDAGRVAIGGVEHVQRLDQIDADDQRRARAQNTAGIAQESRRFVRFEIADGGARKESDPHRRGLRRRR